MSVPALVLGAAQSGSGKTTAALALILALRRQGLHVQPFKVGPDYLDASLLSWAAGRPCRNLDAWLLPEQHLLELFHRACSGADLAVVEGVMGLFDGRSGTTDEASTAHVARLLGAPVVLVLDAQRSSRTAGAVALGLGSADSRLHIVGAILNRVATPRHLDSCRAGLEAVSIHYLGQLPRDPDLALGQRYLGLVSAAETPPPPRTRRALAVSGASLDLEAIRRRAGAARPARDPILFPNRRRGVVTRIAVARDRAFNFYYQDSLDLLQAWGAELVPFSPLADEELPPRSGGVYLGGGYPELFAAELAANWGMRRSLRRAAREGRTIYAECGGAMYVASAIEDAEGRRHRMAGLWPASVSLEKRRLSVGYRTVRACAPSFLAPWQLPGHEFHYSQLRRPAHPQQPPAWAVLDDGDRPEGYAARRLVASYIHLHLGSRPRLARAFVDACWRAT
jgi:cobyrinic acid a,c-diamide synthase